MTSPPPTNVRWLVVALLVGLAFLAHFNRISMSVAGKAHFTGDGKLSQEQMGLVYSTFLFVYAVGMLPGGWLIDRLGPRRAMAGMAVGFGGCTVLTGALGWGGLAVPAMLLPLLVIRGIAGAASVPLHPGAARAVSLWTPLRDRSAANGLVTAGALAGIAASYPAFGALMDAVGWPAAFAISGGALVGLGVLWYTLAADDPGSHRRANAGERELVGGAAPAPARTTASLRDVLALLRDRNLLLVALSYGALGYMQYMFFYWIETYFGDVLKLDPSEGRWATFVVTIASAVGMAAGGVASDRVCRRLGFRRGCQAVALTGMGLTTVFCLLGVSTTDPKAVTAWFALALGSLGLCEGIFWTAAPALAPRNGGLACAVVNTSGNGVGLLAPALTPLIAKAAGWNAAVVVACVVCGVGGLLWLGVRLPADEMPTDGRRPPSDNP